ncbi:MAG: hypothetical protein ACQCN4_07095 [Candidatus Bathyarchaeia archaeon]
MNSKEDSTYSHIHTAATSTWLYVVLVVEISQPTPNQKLKPIASPKCIVVPMHSCGVPYAATPT